MSSNTSTNSAGRSQPTNALDYQARIADKIARENVGSSGTVRSSVRSAATSSSDGTSGTGTSTATRTPSARLAEKISRDNNNLSSNSAANAASAAASASASAAASNDRTSDVSEDGRAALAMAMTTTNGQPSRRPMSSPSIRLAQKIASDSSTSAGTSTAAAATAISSGSSNTQKNIQQNTGSNLLVASTPSDRLVAKMNRASCSGGGGGGVAEDNKDDDDGKKENVITISDHDAGAAAPAAVAVAPIGAIAVGGIASTSPTASDDVEVKGTPPDDGPPILEATLVQSERMTVDEEAAVVAQVVEERRICGINVADRGVRRCLVLVVGIAVVAAVIVGVVVGKSSGTTQPSTGGATNSSSGDGDDSIEPGWYMLGEGDDMVGFGGGLFGTSVSLSSDGTRVAVAFGQEQSECTTFRDRQLEERRDDNAERRAACWMDVTAAEVYDFVPDVGENGAWIQLGGVWTEDWRWADSYGDSTNVAISLSGDGNKLGVLTTSGVRMFSIELEDPLGENYTLLEDIVLSETSVSPDYTQFKIALSEDGMRVATSESSLFWNSTETTVGRVRAFHDLSDLFDLDNVQIIQPTAEENYTNFGEAMTMSSSGSTIAFGASRAWAYEPTGEDYEYVFVYKLSGVDNTRYVRAASILGLKEAYLLGPESIALSYDGDTIAVGISGWDEQPRACVPGTCQDAGGRIRTYRRNDDTGQYEQLGTDILGERPEFLGTSLDLSDGGNILVAGGPFSEGGGVGSGVVVTFNYNGTDWEPLGGEGPYYTNGSPGERLGTSVSLGGDGHTVAAGAPTSQMQGVESGAAFVFEFSDAS